MADEIEVEDGSRVRTLEAEVRFLQQRLDQREQVLKELNRRLLQLERGENGISGMERAETGRLVSEIQALHQENQNLREQLGRLHGTKMFRWSSPARDVYARLRRSR
jgi:hypothetical protein